MSDERARRVGHNEALFRQVNETVEELNEGTAGLTGTFDVVCECGELTCTDQVEVDRAAYEQARSNPLWFVVTAGHELPDVEHVVHTGDGYVIVEKGAPEAQRAARETDPRS